MRLVTFALPADPTHRLGILEGDGTVRDLWDAAHHIGQPIPFDPGSMLSLIEAGPSALSDARTLAADAPARPLAELSILAPIPRPRKNVFCVGWNYLEHFEEGEKVRQTGLDHPKHPVFFSKAPTAVTGPFDPIPFDPAVSTRIDWEVELAVVIGRAGKNIQEADAFAHVFGYTVVNDVSARDLQRRHGGQWMKGKSLDGSCPMGPWIATADEVNPDALRVITRVNGVVKQDASTRQIFFKIPRLLAELSLGMTLEPGDILSTGTPQGVGVAREPAEFLRPGDLLETEIVGLGCLRNRIGIPAR
ncbi:MAG: fumarylacetoacetate hydrolase family protein [Candidatus Methylomirabilota bacterium]